MPSKLPAIAEAGPESESTATPVISVQDIVHRYNGRSALDHVSFDVRPAELFGLLGPNGSGKTTLFRILSTLMVPTAGRALIMGFDTAKDPAAVRRQIGVVFQAQSVDEKLTAYENLWHQGHLYGLHGSPLKARINEILDRVGLADRMKELVETGFVKSIADSYSLTRDQLLSLDGIKDKSADNMLNAIEASKHRSLARLIFGLNIRHVGGKTAQILAQHFGSMDRLMHASEADISSIPGIGPVVGQSVYSWFQNEQNRALIERLRQAGLNMQEEQKTVEGPLAGQTFLLTGRLSSMTRPAAEEAIVRLGGTIATGVSKNLSHLIVGEDAGSKLAKAQKAGVPIHDEQWLMDLLQQYQSS